METLDEAIRCIQAEMRRDPEVDVPMASLRALTEKMYEKRMHGWDYEEQASLFDLFGQAAMRLTQAERLTEIALGQVDTGVAAGEAEAVVFFDDNDFDQPEFMAHPSNGRPHLFVIPGGRKDGDPATPRKTNHLYVIHGGRSTDSNLR